MRDRTSACEGSSSVTKLQAGGIQGVRAAIWVAHREESFHEGKILALSGGTARPT